MRQPGYSRVPQWPGARWVGILGLLVTFSLAVAPVAMAQTGAGTDDVPQGDAQAAPEVVSPSILPIGPKGVLFYCGNGGNCSEGLTEIKAYYTSLGASPVDQLTTFPTSLSPYALIFLIMPTQAFSSSQVSALRGFLDAPFVRMGRLVVVGDYSTFYTGAAVANALLTALGVPITMGTAAIDCNCERFTSNISPDRLTKGIPTSPGLEFACTTPLTLGAGAKKLVGTITGNQPFVAVHPARRLIRGDVVVVGDSNMFTDLCTPGATDKQFWNNLHNY